MKKAKKQLLGLGGLACVVAMTAFACTLPTGAVADVSGNVDVVVEVYSVNAETKIISPQDGDVYNTPVVDFSEIHSHAKMVKYFLIKYNPDGTKEWTKEIESERVTGDDVSGTKNFSLNLDENGGTGTYGFRTELTSINDLPFFDEVKFTYAAISASQDDVSSNSEKVTYRVYYTAGVKSLTYQLFDSEDKSITDAFTVNTTDPDNGGYMDITINLEDLNLSSGKYQILTLGHGDVDGGGQTIGAAIVTFDYTAPDAPNVPDTGSLLSALNISRVDYLITGIIGFTAISIAALFIVKKSKKSE